jgi:hypothetical protein
MSRRRFLLLSIVLILAAGLSPALDGAEKRARRAAAAGKKARAAAAPEGKEKAAEPLLEGQALEAAVERAIDRGVEHLLSAVEGPLGWCTENNYPSGYAAVQIYALLKAGVSFRHPSIEKGLAILEGSKFRKVYSVSLDLMVEDAILEEIEDDMTAGETRARSERDRALKRMEAAAAWLIAARLRGIGAWNYGPLSAKGDPRTARWDNSNTQFAVLALGVAAERKLAIPREIWEEIADHFLKGQDPDGPAVEGKPVFREPEGKAERPGKTAARKEIRAGDEAAAVRARGWTYVKDRKNGTMFSMTCAGLSSLLLAERNLRVSRSGQAGEPLRKAIRDGCGWVTARLGEERRARRECYNFYSLEKVGDIAGIEAFGSFRWYDEFARILIRTQAKDGSWGTPEDEAKRRSDTSLALLFLARATDLAARSGPALRITPSGGGPGRKDEGVDRIYIPSLGGEVLVARLARLLRHRPGKGPMRIAEDAAKAIDPEKLDVLVVPLAGVLRGSPFPAGREFAAKLLGRLTGVEGRDPKWYEGWAERFREVLRIGKAADATGAGKVLKCLAPSEGGPLRLKALWALERTRSRAALGDIAALLEDDDPAVREAARGALVFISGGTLPFHPKGPEKTRAEEARAWREWIAAGARTDG